MAPRKTVLVLTLAAITVVTAAAWWMGHERPHNVIIFVADGLRSRIVNPQTAPEMASIRREGVDFANSHSLFPTVTTVNASVIATGHQVGDTGNFGNAFWVGQSTNPASPTNFAVVEDEDVQRGLAKVYGGNYLNEESLLAAARRAGYSTAVVGKEGPAWVQDVTGDPNSILIDDETGGPQGRPLSPELKAAFKKAGIKPVAEDRGLNADPGAFNRPGVTVANVVQQDWMTAAVTKVLLPLFQARHKPFVMVFWSRDPDGTQHNTGDGLNKLTPGINGPTALAGVRNADNDLARIRAALKAQGLDKSTDIFVTADHGFSVLTREGSASEAAKLRYPDVVPGFVPQGFFAIDMAKALGLPLADGAGLPIDPAAGFHLKTDGALLGKDPLHPQVMIADNGGSAAIYLPPAEHGRLADIMNFLTRQDYVAAIFADDALGQVPGALPLSAIGLAGSAKTVRPTLEVSFKSFSTGCADAELCAAEFAETGLQQGEGIHGSFSRANSHNFMAAIGPDFKAGYRDPAPISNADIAPTLARILKLDMRSVGKLKGRVIEEAYRRGGDAAPSQAHTLRSKPGPNGFVTVLNLQTFGPIDYLDAAGTPGRTVGLRN
ncbi:MAG: alkaline phosphatase family protein [Pseudomonadota bacterium]|nr:alkaline phosphatase family protein [Pseudomonadota bacterium]